MIAVTIAFVAGVLVFHQSSHLPGFIWLPCLWTLSGVLLYYRKWVSAGFVLGWSWAFLVATLALNDNLRSEWEGKDLMIEGVVAGLPANFDRGVRFGFLIESIRDVPDGKVPAKLRLSWYSPPEQVRAGDRWRIKVRLKRPHGSFNAAGFDYEKWLFVQGYRATGYVRNSASSQLLERGGHGYRWHIWRQQIDDLLSENLYHRPMGGIVKALVIGSRNEISPGQWEVLRRTGTAHLVAISGLHIGLVAGLCFFLMHRAWARYGNLRVSPQQVAALSAIILATVYAAMAGFSLPTRRALIMIAVVMGSIFFQRQLRPGRIMMIALLIIVVMDPFCVLSPGFWLSFGAVFLIAYILAGRIKAVNRWQGMLRVHAITAVGLTPLLLLYFQQVSVIAPLANLIAVPLVSLVIVPVCLVGTFFLTLVPVVGNALVAVGDYALNLMWVVLVWLSELPYAQVNLAGPPWWAIALSSAGIVLLFSPRGIPGRWLGLLIMLPLFFTVHPSLRPGTVLFTLMDVGQGLAAVVQTTQHTLVFDTGARFSRKFDMGKAVLTPFLRSRGIKSIDALIVSHGDNDHIGGAESLSQAFNIARTYASTPQQIGWIKALPCQAGQTWRWDRVEFNMLSPLVEFDNQDNENSCVLQVVSEAGSILLTGDIESKAEYRLVKEYGVRLASNYLVVPHHGSNTSSTMPFLRAVRPDYALIPVGYRNRYGFPRQEVLDRLTQLHIGIFKSATAGAIQIRLDNEIEGSHPESYRLSHSRYYHFQP